MQRAPGVAYSYRRSRYHQQLDAGEIADMANQTPNSSLTERQRRLDGFLKAALVTENQRQLDDFLTAALDKLNDMDRVANEHLAAKKTWWHRLTRYRR